MHLIGPDLWTSFTVVTGQILFTTHTAGFLSLQLYSEGEQPTPQEEVFTASVSRVEKLPTPKLTGQVYFFSTTINSIRMQKVGVSRC